MHCGTPLKLINPLRMEGYYSPGSNKPRGHYLGNLIRVASGVKNI